MPFSQELLGVICALRGSLLIDYLGVPEMYINEITQNEQQLAQQINQVSTNTRALTISRPPVPRGDEIQALAETDRLVTAARIIGSNPEIRQVQFISLDNLPHQVLDALGSVFSYLSEKRVALSFYGANEVSFAFLDALAQSQVKSCKLMITHDLLHKICETLPKMKNLHRLHLSFHHLTQRSSLAVLNTLQNCRSLEFLEHRNHGSVRRATVNGLIERVEPSLLANRHRNARIQAFEALFPGDKPNKLDDRKGHRFLSAFVGTTKAAEKIGNQGLTAVNDVVGSKLAGFLTTDDAISVARTSRSAFNGATALDTNTYRQIDRLRALYMQ